MIDSASVQFQLVETLACLSLMRDGVFLACFVCGNFIRHVSLATDSGIKGSARADKKKFASLWQLKSAQSCPI